jgi:hypothetical protein
MGMELVQLPKDFFEREIALTLIPRFQAEGQIGGEEPAKNKK